MVTLGRSIARPTSELGALGSGTVELVDHLVFSPLFVGVLFGVRGYLTAKQRFLVSSAVNGVVLAMTIGLIPFFAIPRL